MSEPIDFSRYRIVKRITDRYAAGESIEVLGLEFFDGDVNPSYMVELIVAAADREGKYEASLLGEAPEGYDASREDV